MNKKQQFTGVPNPALPSNHTRAPAPLVVRGLVGPGLTVVATPQDTDRFRYIFFEQLAADVATGENFLGHCQFETNQGRVLLVAHGPADYKGMINRGIVTAKDEYLNTREGWPTIKYNKHGCISELMRYKKEHSDFKLAILGDFDFVKSPIGSYLHYIIGDRIEVKDQLKVASLDKFARDMEVDNVSNLRSFCHKHGVSIVVGHELTDKSKKLLFIRGLKKCDAEIHLIPVEGERRWRLTVKPKRDKIYIETCSWDLSFDNKQDRFNIHELFSEETRVMKAKSKDQLPLNKKDIKILNAMWGQQEPISEPQISKLTGIARATVRQRLMGLAEPSKGERVIPIDGDRGALYLLANNERNWD